MEKNSYESVDDGSPSWVTSQKWTEKKFRQLRVKNSVTTPEFSGFCLKTGQHFIFVIIYLLLPINCIILDSVSKILFNFLLPIIIYDSNNEKIAL